MNAADIYKEIYAENAYLREGLAVEPGNVVVDIGANIGLFSTFILEKVPQLRLVAIEPIPQNFAASEANLQKYQPPQANVTLLNVGLAEREKTAEFEFYPRVPSDATATLFDFEFQVKAFAAKTGKGIGRLIALEGARLDRGEDAAMVLCGHARDLPAEDVQPSHR